MPNWGEVLKEIQQESVKGPTAPDIVRRRYLKRLFQLTKRNVIAYYSGFLSKPGIQLLDINDEDMNGFMMAVHKLDRSKGLDLILHTPGGNIATTESLVTYLHTMFERDIRVIVPQIAMSAGTMIACSSREIVLGKQSSLGPIDPQFRGIPAQGVINEFKQALLEYKQDPASLQVWQSILQQYRPTFLGQCKQAIEWTKSFVSDQLSTVMFAGDPDAKTKAATIVEALSDTDVHKAHERHIPLTKCIDLGLKVRKLEDDPKLQDVVLTVHHCYMHTLMNTSAFKLIENHLGTGFVKHQLNNRSPQ
ncbi:MAG: S49 family peptidase [Bryobacteraceae bacterium]